MILPQAIEAKIVSDADMLDKADLVMILKGRQDPAVVIDIAGRSGKQDKKFAF